MLADDRADILPRHADGDLTPQQGAWAPSCPLDRHPRLLRLAVAWMWVNWIGTLVLWSAAVLVAGWALKGWTIG